MRDRGKVGFFGFSGLGDPKALHELVDSGEFHGFQCYYNLLNPSAGQPVPPEFSALDYGLILDRAAAKGMGAFVIRVFAGGRAHIGSEHRWRWQRPDFVSGFGLSRGFATRRKGESRAWSRRKKSHSSGDSLRLDESESLDRARRVFQYDACGRSRGLLRRAGVVGRADGEDKKLWETDFGK